MKQHLEEFFFSPSFSLCPLQLLSPLRPSQPHPAVGAMALALCAILVALPCLSHATAPDCEDLVKPIMPEDPSQVRFLVFLPSSRCAPRVKS